MLILNRRPAEKREEIGWPCRPNRSHPCPTQHKSCMNPINISEQRLHDMAQVFDCKMGTLPFTYLGLPVGTTRPKMTDFLPLVDCMEIRLTASSTFLTQGGRL